MKYKVGDLVKVKLGKDKGKTGKVERVITKESKIIVAGLNLYKKHLYQSHLSASPFYISLP